MRHFTFFIGFIGLFFIGLPHLCAQSLSVKDITHFFSPSITLRSETLFSSSLMNTDSIKHLNTGAGIQANIPLKGKIEFDLNMGKLRNLKDLKSWNDWKTIKHSIPMDIHAYQLFLTLGGGYRQVKVDFDQDPYRLPYFSGGFMGIHLQKKLRFLFYSANVLVSEDVNTFKQARPFFNALIGQAKLHKFKFLYYYGAFVSVGNKRVLPVPFAGISAGLPGKFRVQVILPLQASVTYTKNKKMPISATAALSGFTSGFENRTSAWLPGFDQRLGFANNFIQTTVGATRLFSKSNLRVEAGAAFAQGLSFFNTDKTYRFQPKIAPYLSATYQINFANRSLVAILFDKVDFTW